MKELFVKYKEIILYLIFGVLTTLINIVIFFLFSDIFKINYLFSNVVAWIISVTFAFITNKLYVFEVKNNENTIKEAVSFVTFRLVSLAIDMLLMFIMIDIMKVNKMISKVIVNALVVIINYVTSKLFTFKK